MEHIALRILFVNWRDLSHPAAGGAEVFTEEIGKRLVKLGNEVTIFTSAFDGCENETSRSEMKIIRNGGKYGVYRRARGYVKRHQSEFDIIIDEINTIPFGIPRIAKKKRVVALIHQLARETWFYETRFPVNILGYYALEPLWLREYRHIPTITVSDSTEMDLMKRGFDNVHIVNNGIGIEPLTELPDKAANPTLVFLARLVRSKRPDHAISAFKRVREVFPHAELWILGDGYMRKKLESAGVSGITFFGKVGDREKFKLLKKAHVLLVPSIREGWGVSVIEANAMGTPAVGYDVPGLKDSILDGVTGLRVPQNPSAMSRATIRILRDSGLSETMGTNSLAWSKTFNWDQSAAKVDNLLTSLLTARL